MNALGSFDPDDDYAIKEKLAKEKAQKLDLSALSHCPTCKQALAKKIKRDEIWKVIRVFKMLSFHDVENKGWDTIYLPRYMRPAKELIMFMDGDWKAAANAVQDIYEKMTELGRTVTFETIVKHSADWKMKNQERIEKNKIIEII